MPRSKALLLQVDLPEFRRRLLRWFDQEKRALPWRGEKDPYRILVSEVMLQQTRVAVVEERYKQFLGRFPTVEALARSREETVLAAWSGLGYYRRARSLHAAAREISRSGFPRTREDLAGLPGVGRYTASAVASIAFGEAVAVVDGNVKRVLQRVLGGTPSDNQCWQTAGQVLDAARPGDFNQSMMELGALVCLPGRPLCTICPVAAFCAERGGQPARKPARRRKAVLRYALSRRNGSILLQQRPPDRTLMPGMWELPLLAARPEQPPMLELRHSITTTDYSVFVFAARVRTGDRGRWVPLRSAAKLPLTGLTQKILNRLSSK